MPRQKKASNASETIDKMNDLFDYIEKNGGTQGQIESDEARPHVSKADVQEARGKGRTGPPRAIKSDKGITQAETINVTAPDISEATFYLRGIEPLITNCWSWKVVQQLLQDHLGIKEREKKGRQKGKGKNRDFKDPLNIFINSLYEHPDGGYGFPSNGIKKALVSACSFVSGINPRFVRGAVIVCDQLSQIYGTPQNRFDMVTVKDAYGKQSPDTRFRGEFKDWAIRVRIRYAGSIIGLQDIINLFTWAGNSVGIGEWRMEKDGNNGSFRVASDKEVKDILKHLKIADRKKVNEVNSGTQKILEKYRVWDITPGGDDEEEAA